MTRKYAKWPLSGRSNFLSIICLRALENASGETGKTAKHQFEIERFPTDEDKSWNFRNSTQKAGSSAGPLTAILERLELSAEKIILVYDGQAV